MGLEPKKDRRRGPSKVNYAVESGDQAKVYFNFSPGFGPGAAAIQAQLDTIVSGTLVAEEGIGYRLTSNDPKMTSEDLANIFYALCSKLRWVHRAIK